MAVLEHDTAKNLCCKSERLITDHGLELK